MALPTLATGYVLAPIRGAIEEGAGGAEWRSSGSNEETHTHTHTLPLDDPQDYAKFREIADTNGSLLMCDMAHISGLVATGNAKSPFEFCDIVTTTTHKSLRGPRGAMIFFRKGVRSVNKKGVEIMYARALLCRTHT